MDGFIQADLSGSFLLNAGIAGFIRFLEHNEAAEGTDYIISGQTLSISRRYLTENNLAVMYVNTMAELMGPLTKLHELLFKKDWVENVLAKEEIFEKDKKSISNYFTDFVKKLEGKSFTAGYEIAGLYPETSFDQEQFINSIGEFKKEKDLRKKLELCQLLCAQIEKQPLKNILLFKELLYSKIKMFFEGTSFFLPANLRLPIEQCYQKDFVNPLMEELTTEKARKKRCIECSSLVQSTRPISFMIDTTDDVNRKKSYYWNCKPDAFVCPLCAFLYTFVPLGFTFLGADAVFINNNSDIESMRKLASTYQQHHEIMAFKSKKARLYHPFISEKINILSKKLNTIQVILKCFGSEHYEMKIISRDIIEKLKKGNKELSRLENKFIKTDDGFQNVCDMVLDNILSRRNQYSLIHMLLIHSLRGSSPTVYLFDILKLQIIFHGGNQMELLQTKANNAFYCGYDLRYALNDIPKNQITSLNSKNEDDIDNSIRGLIYRLTNAVSVNNRDKFLDSIIRVYSGKGIAIPYIFKECLASDEMFRVIGHAFILGMKYVKNNPNNNKAENQQ